ncbi:hypothetical protein [Sphingomonas sp. dw_22]|uniref:hypothetical protein n=1 Tax=Sphingomonas sp. dw_22 TaxID=2721175 RepID=UPI001BD39D07|nr:hypothetical protein [Sphingomonas sp. dw_22]
MVTRIKPIHAVGACLIFGVAAISIAVCYSADPGNAAIAGAGALGQVIVAVLLYYLTREQLDHTRSETAYRRVEQKIAKHERRLDDMVRIQVAYNNSKTGIGKTKCDRDQIDRLHQLRDDMRQFFKQPVSQNFNRMCEHAKAAGILVVGDPDYLREIDNYAACNTTVYDETKLQIENMRQELAAFQRELEAL